MPDQIDPLTPVDALDSEQPAASDDSGAPELTPVDALRVQTLCAAAEATGPNVTVHSVAQTESTNADAAKLAQRGVTGIEIVVATTQTAGRGRLDRRWTDQGADSLSFSMVRRVPSSIPVENWGWIPLLAGMAVAEVVRAHGVQADTKWPNDVIVTDPTNPTDPTDPTNPTDPTDPTEPTEPGETMASDTEFPTYKKLAGILSEAVSGHVVVGIGLNLTGTVGSMPVPTATSVLVEGGTELTREDVLAEIVIQFDLLWNKWVSALGDASDAGIAAEYAELSASIGSHVKVRGPGGPDEGADNQAAATEHATGHAIGVDSQGRLLVAKSDGTTTAVSVGDIVHLRH